MKKMDFEKLSDNERLGVILEGNSYFASVHKPSMSAVKKFKGRPVFQLFLGVDASNEEKAKRYGLPVLEPTDNIPERHVKISRKVREGKTVEQVKPAVVDSMQKPIPPTIAIGNKSKVICKFGVYWSDFGPKPGVKTNLFKVQVRDLVPFTPTEAGFVMEDGGFTVDTPESDAEFDD